MAENDTNTEADEEYEPAFPAGTFTVGSKDTHGNIIKYIYSSSDFYAVYDTDEDIHNCCVTIIAVNEDIKESVLYDKNYDLLNPKLNELKSILYKCGNDEAIKHIRGSITALGLNNPEHAIVQLENLITNININYKASFEKKIFYLGGSFGVLVLFCILSATIRFNAISGTINPKFETLELIFYIITSGVLGGFISVSYKLKSVVLEKDISRYYFLAYGVERLVISILASIVVFFSIKANIAFGFIKDTPNPFYGYIFFGVLAGFSETLIPDLLIKMEKQGQQEKKN